MSPADFGLNVTGGAFAIAAVIAVCAVLLTPLARQTRDTPLLEIRNPIELGWAATARLLRPALWTALVAGVLNIVIRLVAAAI